MSDFFLLSLRLLINTRFATELLIFVYGLKEITFEFIDNIL